MIHRLRKVTEGLYRGSAPSPKDVLWLKDNLNIKKIISLDLNSGQKINRITKLLDISHIILPLNHTKSSLINFLHHDLKKLFLEDGPTYVHCFMGKDRTGFVVALLECRYLNKTPEFALHEARKLGFGIGLDPKITHLYEKIIKSCKHENDSNNADIVSNEREYKGDNKDSFLDEGHLGSFAPYLSQVRQYPYDNVYLQINDQSPTRENYKSKPNKLEEEEGNNVPLVGLFNNDAGGQGFGPAINMTGFIYD
jgi:hypothetical protein